MNKAKLARQLAELHWACGARPAQLESQIIRVALKAARYSLDLADFVIGLTYDAGWISAKVASAYCWGG